MKRFIKTQRDKDLLIDYIKNADKPITVSIEQGIHGKRSLEQNRLQRLWLNELAEQGDMTAEEYRAYCKLHFGVAILRSENDEFRKAYDEKIKHCYDYATKLKFMAMPFDFPVTRLMTVKQHKKFLDEIYIYFTGKGFALTDPNDVLLR